jgi:hypothetical protein
MPKSDFVINSWSNTTCLLKKVRKLVKTEQIRYFKIFYICDIFNLSKPLENNEDKWISINTKTSFKKFKIVGNLFVFSQN